MEITETKPNPEKANNAKYSRTKLAWFSRFLQHSARKRGGLILQRSWAHKGPATTNKRLLKTDDSMKQVIILEK